MVGWRIFGSYQNGFGWFSLILIEFGFFGLWKLSIITSLMLFRPYKNFKPNIPCKKTKTVVSMWNQVLPLTLVAWLIPVSAGLLYIARDTSLGLSCVTPGLRAGPQAHILRLISKPILAKRIHNLASHNGVGSTPRNKLGPVQFTHICKKRVKLRYRRPAYFASHGHTPAMKQKITNNVWR